MRSPGIEPGSPAWQASILPLDQLRLMIGLGFHRRAPALALSEVAISVHYHCATRR
jgi:hypothetical protein